MSTPVVDYGSQVNVGFAKEIYPLMQLSIPEPQQAQTLKASSTRGRRLSAFLLILSFIWLVPITYGSEPEDKYAILLVGITGDPNLQEMYLKETRELYSILTGQLGFSQDKVIVLFDDPEMDPDLIWNTSNRKGFEEACLDLSSRVKKSDLVFVFIEGHGSYDGKTYKLNLVGPDPTAWELAEILYSIPAGRFILVNATNSSGGSLEAFSGEGKIVITATKSGMEKNQTHMGRYFVESLKDNAADSNKDDRVSVLEAFLYTNLKTEDYYKNEGNLQTEHSILEDTGDAQGQSNPTPENNEGFLARTTFFDSNALTDSMKDATAEQQELALEARELERQIEALINDKAKMIQADYDKKLEELLLKLAQINEKLPN